MDLPTNTVIEKLRQLLDIYYFIIDNDSYTSARNFLSIQINNNTFSF